MFFIERFVLFILGIILLNLCVDVFVIRGCWRKYMIFLYDVFECFLLIIMLV